MGSATTQALAATREALGAGRHIDLETARELFAAARIVDDSPQLSGALADPAASVESRSRVVADVFGPTFAPTSVGLLTTVVRQRWSKPADVVTGIEDLAVRAVAVAAPDLDIEAELFATLRAVAANQSLELALGSRMGDEAAKGALAETLLDGRVSTATVLIVSSLVQHARRRRVRQLLTDAIRTVSDQRGRKVATVTSAAPLTAQQSERLADALAKKYGQDVSLNAIIDPSVVGGLRVQVADDVIDGSISGRLADLRQRLAG